MAGVGDGSERSRAPVVIVGAGVAGLVAATTLSRAGRRSVVLEAEPIVGGRLATVKLATARGLAVADHGAQFFTVRSPRFAALVDEWRESGLVREWCRGFGTEGDGFPRYVIEGGMASLARHLAAHLDVETGARVVSVESLVSSESVGRARSGLRLVASDGRVWHTDSVIVTPPAPEALVLVGALLDEPTTRTLEQVTYVPCLALVAVLDGPSAVPSPGGVQLDPAGGGVFSWVGDNRAKAISATDAVTFHANDDVSQAWFDEPDDVLQARLVTAAREFLGSSTVIEAEVIRHRHARPVAGHTATHLVHVRADGSTVAFAGDGFGGAKVEGAALSGIAAAESIVRSNSD